MALDHLKHSLITLPIGSICITVSMNQTQFYKYFHHRMMAISKSDPYVLPEHWEWSITDKELRQWLMDEPEHVHIHHTTANGHLYSTQFIFNSIDAMKFKLTWL